MTDARPDCGSDSVSIITIIMPIIIIEVAVIVIIKLPRLLFVENFLPNPAHSHNYSLSHTNTHIIHLKFTANAQRTDAIKLTRFYNYTDY